MKNLNKSTQVFVVVMAFLSVAGLVGVVLDFEATKMSKIISCILCLLSYGMIFFYVFAGYKKPHGNLLKYVMFVYVFYVSRGILTAENVAADAQGGGIKAFLSAGTLDVILTIVTIVIVSYMAGRLQKIDPNRGMAVFVIALLFVQMFISESSFISDLNAIVLWIDILCVYVVRYELHKEAGLEDKK